MSITFDPLSSEFSENPYIIYDQLRQADGPTYFEQQDMWLLSRYEDVVKVATSPHMVRSLDGLESSTEATARQIKANWHDMPHHERFVQFSLLDSDGDVHRRLRKLIFGEFTTRTVAPIEPIIQSFVGALIERLKDQEEIDFIEDFAAHVPGHVIGHLLGAPSEYGPQLRAWSEQIVQFFDVDRSDERKLIAETATTEFYEFLLTLKAERTKNPKDDLISKMIRDEKAGQYSEDEFISTCMLILMAGHGSTIDVLGSGMHTLLKNPDSLRQLKDNKSLIPNGILEMFRYESPLPFFHRHALIDFEIGSKSFQKGTTFGLLYGAANRDPAAFSSPDIFDIHRTPNRHLAFGQGAHLCLGNNLARLNMKVIFETLLEQFSSIELLNKPVEYKKGLSVRGPCSLPIKLLS